MIICCLGDSLTEGYTFPGKFKMSPYSDKLIELLKQQEEEILNLHVLNHGVSGEVTKQILERTKHEVTLDINGKIEEEKKVLKKKKKKKKERSILEELKLVIILAGTNDLGHGYDVEQIISNLNEIYNYFIEKEFSIFGLTIPECQYEFDKDPEAKEFRKDRLKINEWIMKFQHSSFYTLDIASLIPQSLKECWIGDGLHMNEKGYYKMAELIFDKIKELKKLKSEMKNNL